MRDIDDKVDNDGATPDGQYPSLEFNSLKNEAKNAVLRSGQTLDPALFTQLAESLFLHGTKSTIFQASGSENAVVITPVSGGSGVKIPADYSNMGGVRAVFTATVTNTGATTVNIGQTTGTLLGTKDLRLQDGSTLTGGEIGPNLRTEIEFDAVADYWRVMPWSIPAAQITLPLSISNGGTGATDAAGARTNLQVPPNTRQINTSGLATGGGTLESDRTVTVTASSQAQAEAGTNNTTAMTPLRVSQAINALGGEGGIIGTQVITSNVTYDPSVNGASKVLIIATGGGGASGAVNVTGGSDVQATGGGGAGATGILFYDFASGATGLDVVIGLGGTGGTGNGPNGGNTTVTEVGGGAALIIDVNGGSGSSSAATVSSANVNFMPGGSGGTVATLAAGGLALGGSYAEHSIFSSTAGKGGGGGASYWGGGGGGDRLPEGSTSPATSGNGGQAFGSGGGGVAQHVVGTSSRNGFSGADGVVFIVEYE